MYSKNEYKNEINFRCVLWKKVCSGTTYVDFWKFFNNQKLNHPKSFAEIEKTRIEARIKNESETSTLAPRDNYNKNINPENVDISIFTKISSIMRKRRANNFPPIPRKVEEFDNFLKNPNFGTIDGNIFYRTFPSANDEFALIFLTDTDFSFLNRIHSIHVGATFKTVPVDFYQIPIIHCLVLDTIIPVFYVLMSSKTRLLYHAAFLKNRSLASQFNPETSVFDFEIALYCSIKFVFSSNFQPCLYNYRQSLYRKWQQLWLSYVKVKEVVSWVNQLKALPLLPTNLIHSVFYELSPSVLEINVLDAMATFYSYVEKQWNQEKCSLFMVKSTGLIPKSRASVDLSANELVGNGIISGFFLLS